MTTSMTAQELGAQIEQLVQDFIERARGTATAAVERAFSPTPAVRARERRGAPAERGRRGRQVARRRSPQEMETLGERLYQEICARPGETMAVLAPAVGSRAVALQFPATRLKKAGRIRSVGQRNRTRYFPMVKNVSRLA